MSGGSGVQYSPDGRWWWDGSQWRPVPGQAAPPSPTAQVPAQMGQPDLTSAPAPPRPRARLPAVVIAMLAICALLLVAGGVGLFLALRSVADRLSSTANAPMPAVSLPVGAPGTALSLPPIPGVTVSGATAALQAKGYTCTGTRSVAGAWITLCSLNDEQNGLFYDVSLGGSDPTSVGAISAGVLSTGGGPPTTAEASQFFQGVVGAIARGGQAAQANSWILQNLDQGGDGTAGTLRLHLARPGSNYLLVVTATTP